MSFALAISSILPTMLPQNHLHPGKALFYLKPDYFCDQV